MKHRVPLTLRANSRAAMSPSPEVVPVMTATFPVCDGSRATVCCNRRWALVQIRLRFPVSLGRSPPRSGCLETSATDCCSPQPCAHRTPVIMTNCVDEQRVPGFRHLSSCAVRLRPVVGPGNRLSVPCCPQGYVAFRHAHSPRRSPYELTYVCTPTLWLGQWASPGRGGWHVKLYKVT